MSEIKHSSQQLEAVRDAIAASLGDTYDCTRVWSAWSVGTMSQDDFVPVVENDDRLQEIAEAALDASGAHELLEALLALSDLRGAWIPPDEVFKAAWSKARAAIAKATGAA